MFVELIDGRVRIFSNCAIIFWFKMVEVRPGLLLGSMDDVFVHVDRPRRRHQRVTHLLSLLNTPLDWSDIETPQGAPLAMLVCVPDMPAADLLRHFEPCVSFIAEGRETGSILVHWYEV